MIVICAIAALYQLLAILALRRTGLPACAAVSEASGVSVLKPLHGVTPEVRHAIQTHLDQTYPGPFELLLGLRPPDQLTINDPRVRIILCQTVTPNRKVGSLIDLAREARHSTIIVNDADIAVPPNYLEDVVAELERPNIGLVTCIYRVQSKTWPGRWEALGIATDFAPSALIAPFVGVSEFGLGATLAFHRSDLDRIGGFEAIAGDLADDYQLGARLHSLGRRNVIAKPIVTTTLNPSTWAEAWRHQVRWSKTVRLSRTAGYIGLPITFATLWALIAALTGFPWTALALFVIRMAMALAAGYGLLRSPDVLKLAALIPLRDLYTVAVWCAGLFGNKVEWGGEILRLNRRGKIVSVTHVSRSVP